MAFAEPVAQGLSLEERISRILCAHVLELDDNAYKGKYELNDGRSIKKFILDKLRKAYTNFGTGDKITISHNSAGKLAFHWKDGYAYQKSIAHIPEIIERMQFLEKMKPDKENAGFDNYSYYITQANIDGEPHVILSTIGRKRQNIYYDHNIFKGTTLEVFREAKNAIANPKYSRLAEILRNIVI